MGETCGYCGSPIVTSALPDGSTVVCDAEPVTAVVIVDVATKREPVRTNAWVIHTCAKQTATAASRG